MNQRMTENFLKGMFFLILFGTLLLQLILSNDRGSQSKNFDAAASGLIGTMHKQRQEGGGLTILPAGIRRTAR